MKSVTPRIEGISAEGFELPMGAFSLVLVRTAGGMVGCGAFDVGALDKFDYAAARGGSRDGSPIATVEDLLDGEITAANDHAIRRGVRTGMSVVEALRKL